MGHVDHGKTSLLDYIRKTNVVAREAGGITQSVGAYEIEHSGKKITFIDTPGHEAFTSMRSRGAKIADLAILVIAGDEGLKPQTHESIKILQDSKTPFVVAITKTDKPNTDIEKIKNELTTAGVLLEGYGGSISYQPISAKTGEHVNDLLDLLLLAAELEELTYDPHVTASGFVLESRMDRRRGNEATIIIKNGTLKFGDEIVTETASGKVKILENFLGKAAKSLEPSAPAVVIGLERLPQVGEEFTAGKGLEAKTKPQGTTTKSPAPILAPNVKDESFKLILKAADAGSLEALSLIIRNMKLRRPVKVIAESVGDVVDNDVQLAISTGSVIAAFANRIDKGAKNLSEANKVRIFTADVIYHLVEAIEKFVNEENTSLSSGVLEVLAVFNKERNDKQLVGGKVTEGTFKNHAPFMIERAGIIVGRGRIMNLQQQKKETSTVAAGNECGVLANAEIAIEQGDRLIIT